ncbi:MAG: sigma-70 family RNA polymerase sigma factor [Phycisphaerae bacterium]|nr:sigma-70 family RNA polymerase sigma factor [Phycisphaerae bacterium]
MNAPTDETLMAEYLAGQTDRFELLVRRHSQELFHFLARFTGSAASADDVIQETFLQVHLAANSFDRSRRFKPWLFTIAANKARDMLRGRARRPEVPLDVHVGSGDDEGQRFVDFLADDADVPLDVLAEAERREVVQRVVDGMPDHLREVLVLGYYHRFPYKDMADVLGIPLGTVKSRLHAAVAHFARAYQAAVNENV